MSNLALTAAPINFDNNENENNTKSNKSKNKTIKNRRAKNRIHSVMKKVSFAPVDDDNEMGDFSPPPKPVSVGAQRTVRNENERQHQENQENHVMGYERESDDEPVNLESYNNLESGLVREYYKNFIPNINNMTNNNVDENLLLEKLDYMIHLLEEQKDVKTGHVTEEVVLYSFLGIFIIFVLDSFARAGKYVR